MEVTDKIIAAVIASCISLVIALITYKSAFKKLKEERLNFEKELEHRYIDKLFEKRMQMYPSAFASAGKIYRLKAPEYITPNEKLRKIKYELKEWAEGEAGLFISKELIEAFNNLMDVLSKKPGNIDSYTLEQADKIWKARNDFRASLRKDLGILHVSYSNNST